MPPRLQCSSLSSAVASCSSVRPQAVALPVERVRAFSQSSCRQVTQRRRQFYEWLNGPGKALKNPLPGSTNYLGAYDQSGALIRLTRLRTAEGGDEAMTKDEEEADELEMAARRKEEAGNKETNVETTEEDGEDKLPPEDLEDLRPFPKNRWFQSQAVLSEELREAIYQYMIDPLESRSVAAASAHFGVSNERIGAVLRLKQMEKEWIAQGKTLAIPYSKAVLEMLPKTPHVGDNSSQRPVPHESINDLIVHPATRQQLFVPVAESRRFTRVDAGKAFDNDLLPADERIPHPEMVNVERDIIDGLPAKERLQRAKDRMIVRMKAKAEKEEAQKTAEKAALTRVAQRRWDFVIQDVSVESAGRNGRDHRGVGWRYGVPHQDRKKGQVKIPTQVEA